MTKAPKSPDKAIEEQIVPDTNDEGDAVVEEAVVLEEPVHPADEASAETPDDSDPVEAEPDDVQAEPALETEAGKAPAMPRRGGVAPFLGFLLGGVAAAAIGFGAARYVVPEGWPFPGTTSEEDPIPGLVAAQGGEIAALRASVADLETALAGLSADTSLADSLEATRQALILRADEAETGIETANTRLDEIEARLAAVEKMAPEGSVAAEAAAEAYDRELTALREMFAGELAKIEAAQTDAAALEINAAEAAQAATGRAALARVIAALDTGQPFAEALTDLSEASGAEVPAALADAAMSGVPTLAQLQADFPVAARAALEAAIRAGVDDGSIGRVEAFLRLQLGTRSLEPKEGADPDAVLSRAEAALRQGDIAKALEDLAAMPEASAPALADWKAQAETRKGALEAGAALAQNLNVK